MKRLVWMVGVAALALAGCNDDRASTRHLAPIPPATLALMSGKGMTASDPILVRAYKKESELEVWKRGRDGEYALLKTYPICRWSGQLGPKVKEGDRQAPEGFYTVTPAQMNPNSSFHLSFDTGFPNAYDRAHGRSGSHLMVHGNCSSRGCYAMTDEAISEVYAVAREAFAGGQRGFQFQALPFRMTAENLAKHRADPHMPFWRNLKEGSDHFETLKDEPKVAVCGGRYTFGDGSCAPAVPQAVADKRRQDEQKVAELVSKGTPGVKVVYADGGQHASFQTAMVAAGGGESEGSFAILNARPSRNLGTVSRPEALAEGPKEIAIEPGKAKPEPKATALAAIKAPARPVATSTLAKKPADAEETAAAARAPVLAAAPAVARPIDQRMFAKALGAPKAPSEADGAQGPEPKAAAAPEKKSPLLPPRRAVSAPAARPQASAPGSDNAKAGLPAERRAEGAAVMRGAQPVVSASSGFAPLN